MHLDWPDEQQLANFATRLAKVRFAPMCRVYANQVDLQHISQRLLPKDGTTLCG